MVSYLRTVWPGLDSKKELPSSRPTDPIQWATTTIYREIKRPESEADSHLQLRYRMRIALPPFPLRLNPVLLTHNEYINIRLHLIISRWTDSQTLQSTKKYEKYTIPYKLVNKNAL